MTKMPEIDIDNALMLMGGAVEAMKQVPPPHMGILIEGCFEEIKRELARLKADNKTLNEALDESDAQNTRLREKFLRGQDTIRVLQETIQGMDGLVSRVEALEEQQNQWTGEF